MGNFTSKAIVELASFGILSALFCATLLVPPWEQELVLGKPVAGAEPLSLSVLMLRPVTLVALSLLILLRPASWLTIGLLATVVFFALNQFWLDLFGWLEFSLPTLDSDAWLLSTCLVILPPLVGRALGLQLRNPLIQAPADEQPYVIQPTILHLVLATTLVAALAAWLRSPTEANMTRLVTWPLLVYGTAVLSAWILLSDTRWYLQVCLLLLVMLGLSLLLWSTDRRPGDPLEVWAIAAQGAECLTLVGWCIGTFGALRALGWKLYRSASEPELANSQETSDHSAAQAERVAVP